MLPNDRLRARNGVIEGLRGLHVASDSTLTPVKGAPRPDLVHDDKSGSEADAEGQSEVRAIIGRDDVERRVFGGRPGAVDKSRVIERGIDIPGIRRLDRDPLPLLAYALLGIRPQGSRRRSLMAQTLDRIHDVCLLRDEGSAELLGP